ncbi:major capsid protein [Amycolatopsis dendrobii]|uniref:Phage major capsid protein n=1 Tax=Amycolatopsis dendrobii TaxID=2760662 RepID=A0A7W3VWI1_9PSEU|nr:phage major capsid protein [Amycolatopsis dendrobii]MBB1153992.1 phage major capsid protein [Amycolatopsis dendrobii]
MAITLADAQLNTQNDIDYAVIDQFRRSSWLMDQVTFDDCVTPGTAGATLTYGYTRLISAAPAAFRAINSEYTSGQAKRQRYTTDLKPLGGSFDLDRVIARLGDARTNETNFQMGELIKSTDTKFANEVVNGDVAVDANGFDGLDKALTGSTTEYLPINNGVSTGYLDWSANTVNTQDKAMGALDVLDDFLSLVVGGAGAIMGNRKSITRVRSLARRSGYYTRSEDALGREIERYGNAVLVDLGTTVSGTTETDIVPIETRDADGAGAGGNITGLTDLYAVRFGLDAFHGVATVGQLLSTWLPDYQHAGAVKKGEVELGPVSMVLKKTTAAAVLRNIKVQ